MLKGGRDRVQQLGWIFLLCVVVKKDSHEQS